MDDLCKRYEQEIDKIKFNRLACWSNALTIKSACGFDLLPLTLGAWIDLQLTENAFLLNTIPVRRHFFEYIWRNHIDYSAGGKSFRKWTIERKVKKAFGLELQLAIHEHIRDGFDEFPESPSNGSYTRSSCIQGIDTLASAIDEVANRYSIDPMILMRWPLNRFFLLQKSMRQATMQEYKALAPQSIREISSQILAELNKKNV